MGSDFILVMGRGFSTKGMESILQTLLEYIIYFTRCFSERFNADLICHNIIYRKVLH